MGTVCAMPPVTPDRISLPDRYRVVRHLANGGMASVWEAHDELLDRDVAVKLLASHLGEDERARRRFQREARAAAGLSSHPNVVTIYDVGEHASRVFMVMEIMRGGTVGDRLKSGGEIPHADRAALAARGRGARWTPRTTPASCTATSSPATCCSTSTSGSRSADFGIARARVGGPADADRAGARHRRLPLARAGDGRGRDRRVGPLRARGRRLRAADRHAPVRGRALRRPGAGARRGPGAARLRARRPVTAVDACSNADWPRTRGPLATRGRSWTRSSARSRRPPPHARPTRRAARRRERRGVPPRRAATGRPARGRADAERRRPRRDRAATADADAHAAARAASARAPATTARAAARARARAAAAAAARRRCWPRSPRCWPAGRDRRASRWRAATTAAARHAARADHAAKATATPTRREAHSHAGADGPHADRRSRRTRRRRNRRPRPRRPTPTATRRRPAPRRRPASGDARRAPGPGPHRAAQRRHRGAR